MTCYNCDFIQLLEAVDFLHELGTLQHFDNEMLRDRVIINPQWIVDVMACVVSVHNQVIKVSQSSEFCLCICPYCLCSQLIWNLYSFYFYV